tara:strand:+ start:5992 stop:6480 length:489 start_codon:yes stop_codon:yes gene_type:complete
MTKTYIKKPKLKFKQNDVVYFVCKITNKPIRGKINSLSVIVRQEREGYGAILNHFQYHILYNNEKINKESNTSVDIDKVFESLQELKKYYDDCIEIDYEIGQDLYDNMLQKRQIKKMSIFVDTEQTQPYIVRASTDKYANEVIYNNGLKHLYSKKDIIFKDN